MKIEVTKDDIADGIIQNCRNCPIAIAIRRATGKDDVWVGGNVTIGLLMPSIPLPLCVGTFIHRFDTGQPVEPFTFDLDYHQEAA